ncbi:hypothetical protein CANINC_000479 [Pichia inconspicua]|uniref:CWF21 domain-containing protein n=1 Tax=Pichia inconspicua TaxID=52247 RepID=A0A4T0X785_9ASCO|nr:hypothetical protein CANINC_000479 [[Candida] inconspicua]
MSYNGIGLKSAKGSATSGHIQKSLYQEKQDFTKGKLYESRRTREERRHKVYKQRRMETMPLDKAIIEHEAARALEVAVAERRDELEEEYPDKSDKEIDEMVAKYREELVSKKKAEKEKEKKLKLDDEKANVIDN